ncbi:MAG: ATP-binding protein, partial [Acidimicrobiaceae bacterium]|nr:ATP-binding protein [Acidimicrobiaceae bacterium]
MRIQSARVKNYRSIRDAELSIGEVTALVGKNGSGKSTFLSALELFYNRGDLHEADFFDENTNQNIEVEITFNQLGSAARDEFRSYLEGSTLTVVGVFSLNSGKPAMSYHGSSLQNPDFANIRRIPNKRERTSEFNALLEDPQYSSLNSARSADAAEAEMKQWELDNPDACVRTRDDGQFFGWTNVGIGRLLPHSQFIRVPAVRDAGDDATDRRGSAITEIMNLVVRNALDNNQQLKELRISARQKFGQIMESDAGEKLESLQHNLTVSLRSFVPDSAVDLQWEQIPEFNIPQPQAHVRLREEGYTSPVTRTGHGLQRAFIFTLLQHLADLRRPRKTRDELADSNTEHQADESVVPTTPVVVLAIDEPELYQHPSRQRHIAKVFEDLALDSDEATKTQIIYTTHSPLFVELDRFDDVRIIRKYDNSGVDIPKATSVHSTTLE